MKSTLAPHEVMRSGFTLIELLIVIAVLGILAVAVLAAINPVEQINRSRDTGSRSDAEQLISAIERNYANSGFYPWQTVADTATAPLGWVEITTKGQLFGSENPKVAMLTKLSGSTAELKATFIDRITQTSYNHLWIYNRGTQGDSTYVCFVPQSAAFLDEAIKRCGTAGAGLPTDLKDIATSVCPGGTPAVAYSCLP